MGRSGPKKFTESQHEGHAGIGLIHMLISEMGHEWHDRVVDVGVDGSIELRDPSTGLMSNQHVMVQSKAYDERSSRAKQTTGSGTCAMRRTSSTG